MFSSHFFKLYFPIRLAFTVRLKDIRSEKNNGFHCQSNKNKQEFVHFVLIFYLFTFIYSATVPTAITTARLIAPACSGSCCYDTVAPHITSSIYRGEIGLQVQHDNDYKLMVSFVGWLTDENKK